MQPLHGGETEEENQDMKKKKRNNAGILKQCKIKLLNLIIFFQLFDENEESNVGAGCTNVGKWIRVSKKKILERKHALANKVKRIRSRIKIHGFGRFRRKWLKFPKFSPVTRYIKLE